MRSDSIFGLCHIQFLEKTQDFFEDKRAHNLECFSLLSSFFYNMNMKSSKEADGQPVRKLSATNY